jgi:nucleolar GTP-binding protein
MEAELTEEQQADLTAIRRRKKVLVAGHRLKKNAANNQAVLPGTAGVKAAGRTITSLRSSLGGMGLDTAAVEARMRERSQSRGRKRSRSSAAEAAGDVEMGDAEPGSEKKRLHSSKSRSMSRGRSLSTAAPGPKSGLRDASAANKAIKMADKAQRKRNKQAKVGEADRVIPTKMPKHLFSGKRGIGKTDRR